LPNSDVSPDTPRAAPASNKPSLVGETVGASTTPKSPDKNTRMLLELESMSGHRVQGSARKLILLLGAVALVAAAGAAWWSQQRAVMAPKPSVSGQAFVVPATPPATPPVAKAAESNQAAASPAAPASASTDVAPSVARIETASTATSAAALPAAVPAATALALAAAAAAPAVAVNAAAPNTSAPQKSVASAAQPPAKARVAKTNKTAKSTKTAKQQRQAKQQLAKAKKSQQGSAAPTRSAKASATSVRAAEPTVAGAGKDADILLLSALLAHVSRDAQGAPTGSQAQQTIAQIVQRCEARGGRESVEANECRRRICDGYWGKAQACPANLAPKKE
jgi:hypothetical protein